MARENVARFEELLRTSAELQRELGSATAAFEGDANDTRAVFEAVIAPLAVDAGLPFTFDEALASSERELSEEELSAVAGGWGLCYAAGISSGPEADCGYAEGHACAYVGVSLIDIT